MLPICKLGSHFDRPTPDRSSTGDEDVKHMCKDHATGVALHLLLRLIADPSCDLVGTINLTQIARGPFQACYLGFGLDERAVGRGLMQEALEVTVAFAFQELALHRVMANHLPENLRSARVLRRLGFCVEGYARDYLYIAGAWRDHVLTSLTNPKAGPPGY
jgi:ribosomal-protein-alanine N-acetyltransferase